MSFRIDLETKEEQRWLPILKIYKYKIKAAHDALFLQFGNSKWIQMASKLISMSSYFGYIMHKKEIQSISEQCNINFGDLVLAQIIYELSACCTSLIYKHDGEYIHFRSMDWPLKNLADLTITIDFFKNNKLVYSTVTWAGFVGIMTSVKPDVGSVALNFRRTETANLWTTIKNLTRGKWPASYLIRYAMETSINFNEMKSILSVNDLVAPCYFILGHPFKIEKSITIVRNRESFWIEFFKEGKLIQTNHDISDPKKNSSKNILYSYQREQVCHDFVNSRFAVLHKFPVINEDTVFYLNMYPKTGTLGSVAIINL